MTMCPRCGSSFLQPLRCEAKGSDVVLVELRCSDCMTWLKAPHTRADMRELDRLQAEFRAVILEQYERSVAESMEALAACLGHGAWNSTSSRRTTSRRRGLDGNALPDSAPDDERDPGQDRERAADDPDDRAPDTRPAGRHDDLAGARPVHSIRRRPPGASKWPIEEALPSVSEKPWRLPLNCVPPTGNETMHDVRATARSCASVLPNALSRKTV